MRTSRTLHATQGPDRRWARLFAAAAVAAAVALVPAGTATAKVVNLRVHDEAITDGTGSVGAPAPFSSLSQMDLDRANGDFVVGGSNQWYRFDSTGAPKPFAAIAPNTVVGPTSMSGWSDVAVDNSGEGGGVGEGEQGRIYGMQESGAVKAWKPNGEAAPGGFGTGVVLGGVCAMDVAPDGDVWLASYQSQQVVEFNPDGTPTGQEFNSGIANCGMEIDAAGNFYLTAWPSAGTHKYSPTGEKLMPIEVDGGEATDVAVDHSDGHVYLLRNSYVNEYDASGGFVTRFGEAEGPFAGLQSALGIAAHEGVVYVANNRGPQPRVDSFVRTGPITVPDVTTGPASVTPSTATLTGEVDPDLANGGTPIDVCNFEWGPNPANLANDAPCDGTPPFDGPVEATIESGLTLGTTYYYRLTAANEGNGIFSSGGLGEFEPAGPPEITQEAVSEVNTDGARISANINPGGGDTTYRIEYGTTPAYGSNVPIPDGELQDNLTPEDISHAIAGLTPGTEYHFRIVATNPNGTTEGPDRTFRTFPSPLSAPDPCSNAQVRQLTGAAHLLDCRAYEIASAPDTDGYDVTSDLIPGKVTLPPQPRADDRVLYSLDFGVVPGIGDPTNFEKDPYVARRTTSGWQTEYVGLPASGIPSQTTFGSPLAGADSGLGTFAFGGGALCKPCFPDGSTGIPVRLAGGAVVQGLRGSIPSPGAEPAGYVGRRLSDDGSHLVFGTTAQLESADTDGGLSIYKRNLNAGTTHFVSRQPNGQPLGGTVAALDVSADGSRVLVGREVGTDAAGNTSYDLFMHIGTGSGSVEVVDTASGVIFNGMTRDGSRVFFTTRDAIAGTGDTDTSADLFRADVSASGSTITRVSTGVGAGNSNACDPVPGKEGPNWNVLPGGPTDCSVLGLAGGAGVAIASGAVYFLSPEQLDGSGTPDAANLFVARPGETPRFVATVEPDQGLVLNALIDSEVHRFEDFQTTASGNHAVFASTLSLTELDTLGFSQVYRYDAVADGLDCVSCATTGAAPTSHTTLASGLNIADDGRVFFTSAEALVLRDTNRKRDVYEWKDGEQQLVSTGLGKFDAGLVAVSADGVNVFFFTRDTLVPQDQNGETMKIYDARAGGGFLVIPPLPLCAAKDECHGPGTVPAPPPQIGTFKGRGGNVGRDCGAIAKRGRRAARRARVLRRRAARAPRRVLAKRLRNRARRQSRIAKRSRNAAKRCRRSLAGGAR